MIACFRCYYCNKAKLNFVISHSTNEFVVRLHTIRITKINEVKINNFYLHQLKERSLYLFANKL